MQRVRDSSDTVTLVQIAWRSSSFVTSLATLTTVLRRTSKLFDRSSITPLASRREPCPRSRVTFSKQNVLSSVGSNGLALGGAGPFISAKFHECCSQFSGLSNANTFNWQQSAYH